MQKIKRLFCLFLTSCLVFSSPIATYAENETVQISVVETPNIDVLLTTGRTSFDFSNYADDLKGELQNLGVDTNKVHITAETTLANATTQDFEWTRYWNSDKSLTYWTPYSSLSNYQVGQFTQNGNNLVITGNSTSGGKQILFTEPKIGNAYYDDLTFEYTLDFGDNITGCGLFVGGYIDKETNKLYGYFLSFNAPYYNENHSGYYAEDSHGCYSGYNYPAWWTPYCLYRLPIRCSHGYGAGTSSKRYQTWGDAANGKSGALFKVEWDLVDGYLNDTNDPKNHGHYTLIQDFDLPYYGAVHLVRDGDLLNVYVKQTAKHSLDPKTFSSEFEPYVSNYKLTDYGNLWGFWSEHYSHNCNMIGKFTIGNITLNQKYTSSYADVINGAAQWNNDSIRCAVNINDYIEEDLTDIASSKYAQALATTLSEDVHYIAYSNDKTYNVNQSFIDANDGKGLNCNSSDYNECIKQTARYIRSQLEVDNETQYIIAGKDAKSNVIPESLKTGAVDIEHPNGRWIVHHDYTYFNNNLGQSMQTEMYTPDLLLNFDKPGAYDIYFDDNLVKTVYAHREPVADFIMDLQDDSLTLTSNSYDEDSNEDIGFGKGIAKETWYYKETNATEWTVGKLQNFDASKIYIIKLEVEDFQGATSYTTKYIGTGNPVSYFLTDKTQLDKYCDLNIIDASYDPAGYDIIGHEWVLSKNNEVVKTYTEDVLDIDFQTLGAGRYNLLLKVKNSKNVWSDTYTRSLNVIEDLTPPSVVIDPTFCDWTDSQDIRIQIEDNESGLNKWRYCYTQSQDKPEESDYGSWLTVDSTTLTFNTDGEYYLHFEAFDNVNNKLERTVGSYKITHPYTNKVMYRFNDVGIDKTDFYIYDWGKWYSPTDEFKLNVNGFKIKDNFTSNYPVENTNHNTGDRIKQPSENIEFDFFYEPINYNITYDYMIDCDEVDNPETYNVLEGFKLKNPSRENFDFVGWMLDGEYVEDINYNLDNNFEDFDTFKNAMDKRLSKDITLKAVWNQTGINYDCNVTAEIGSTYKVTIPKTIVLKGQKDTSVNYNVKVEGDIAGCEIVNVVPDNNVVLSTANKNSVTAAITQSVTAWPYADLGKIETGTIIANGLTAGKWSGNFNFNISVDNFENNKNSEEHVEYQDFDLPIEIR